MLFFFISFWFSPPLSDQCYHCQSVVSLFLCVLCGKRFCILRSPDHRITRSPDPRTPPIVACPACEIPCRVTPLHIVRARIFASSHRLQWSTYHVSRLNFSSQVIAFRPFTCAQPVIPGFTRCRRACSAVYRGRYSTNKGLGPTKLNSPRSTFHNCGNSSRLNCRNRRPSPVSRSSSESGFPCPSRASVIVRNFTSSKIFSSFPGRLCRNSTGLPIFILTSSAITASAGDSNTNSAAAPTRSIADFKNLCIIQTHVAQALLPVGLAWTVGTGVPSERFACWGGLALARARRYFLISVISVDQRCAFAFPITRCPDHPITRSL